MEEEKFLLVSSHGMPLEAEPTHVGPFSAYPFFLKVRNVSRVTAADPSRTNHPRARARWPT